MKQSSRAGFSGFTATQNADTNEKFTFTLTATGSNTVNLDGFQLDANHSGSSPDTITLFLPPAGGTSSSVTQTIVNTAI